jgi:hypothetical protein
MKTEKILTFVVLFLFGILIYKYLTRRKVYSNDPMVIRLQADLLRIDPSSSKFQYFSSDESYTEDKKKIYLCLRDENGDYYDYNMLIYVSLHELAHAMSAVVDTEHVTLEFNNLFNLLLKRASDLNLYDQSKPPVAGYCPLKK